jgi:hypothetical protein
MYLRPTNEQASSEFVFASSQHATGGFYLDEPWKHIVAGAFDRLTHGEYELIDETCRILARWILRSFKGLW